jgi:CDP-glucose 4,6-dehydratase
MTETWVGRRVLVTGATGVVGSHLCEKLIGLGAYVVALVRDDDPMSSLYRDGIAEKCSIVRGDLRSFETCMRSINAHDIDTVFHLGAQTLVETAMRDPLETFESNLRGTYNLLEAARRIGIVKAFIVASSDKAYGDSDILPYTEDMPLVGRHPYDVSKSCTDLLSTCYSISYDLPVTIARCGNIYGSGDLNWSRIVPGTIRSILGGQRPVLRSNGTNIRDYIYVSDVVSAYIKLAEQIDHPHVRGEAFNFSPETRVDVFEMVSAISSAMDSKLEPIVLDTATHEIKVQTLDSSKARRILDWRPTWSLDAALRETIPWYQRLLADN